MGWRFVYNKIKELLESEEFKKENAMHNPNTPEGAIKIALVKLTCDYYKIDEYKGYDAILETINRLKRAKEYKVKLMNSAMMPREGVYKAVRITKEEFIEEIKKAHKKGRLESYIGYPQNIELLQKWTGIKFELNREPTTLEDGDIMLVMKLKYRLQNPAEKGKEVSEDDFEFYRIEYSKDIQ